MNYRNVLVVDDCPVVLRRVVKELSAIGYIVRTATDGLNAMQMMRESCPDFVITDWNMPNIQGDVLCRCIRAEQQPHYVYIILMTGHSDELDIVQGLNSGADDYVPKPVDSKELLARMSAGARVLERDRRLTHLSQHDPLTGTLNRLNLIDNLAAEIELCQQRNRPLSCIMLDLDHFKEVNDNYGHLVGDTVLLNVAEVLQAQFRASDYVCRYGGEEFCLVLPGSNEQGAAVCAERCRREFEILKISGLPNTSCITASFGVAEMTGHEQVLTPAELIERADQALYAAKQMGRNRVVKYSQIDQSNPPLRDVTYALDHGSLEPPMETPSID
jgi:diguanylate cyclase (GGDEF)-like protein